MGVDIAEITQVTGYGNQQHGGIAHTAGQIDIQCVTGIYILHNILDGFGLGILVHAVRHRDGEKMIIPNVGGGRTCCRK